MERVWCVRSCSRPGKPKSRCWTLACMKLAETRLGMGPEQPPEGARLVCEPSRFPVILVFAEEVITRCSMTLCRLRDSASHT
jgi:hypothetical protein